MIRPILQLGNAALRKKSAPWADFQSDDLAHIIADLSDTLQDARQKYGYGHGVAAPQIDVLSRVIFIDTEAFKGPLINPTVIWASDEQTGVWDSCFSFGVAFFVLVDRHCSINVEYYDQADERHLLTAVDDLSELLQHEIDHLEGVLAIDRMKDGKMMMRSEWQKIQGRKTQEMRSSSRAS